MMLYWKVSFLAPEFNENFKIYFRQKKSQSHTDDTEHPIYMSHIVNKFRELSDHATTDYSTADRIHTRLVNILDLVDNSLNENPTPQNVTDRSRRYQYLNDIDMRLKGIINSLYLKLTTLKHNNLYHLAQDDLCKNLQKLNNQKIYGNVGGFYMSTNESNSKNIHKFLSETPKSKNGCHLGFSGFHNFDIMAARQSRRGIIMDFNPWNAIIIDYALHLMRSCDTRQEWLKLFQPFVKQLNGCLDHSYFSPNVNPDEEFNLGNRWVNQELECELSREGSWLSSEENYRFIKQLAVEGKIVCFTEDIRNTHTFEKAALWLKNQSVSIDTLYLSNICKYMETESDKTAFQNTIKALAQPKTLVVNCLGLTPKKTLCSMFAEDQNISKIPKRHFFRYPKRMQNMQIVGFCKIFAELKFYTQRE